MSSTTFSYLPQKNVNPWLCLSVFINSLWTWTLAHQTAIFWFKSSCTIVVLRQEIHTNSSKPKNLEMFYLAHFPTFMLGYGEPFRVYKRYIFWKMGLGWFRVSWLDLVQLFFSSFNLRCSLLFPDIAEISFAFTVQNIVSFSIEIFVYLYLKYLYRRKRLLVLLHISAKWKLFTLGLSI